VHFRQRKYGATTTDTPFDAHEKVVFALKQMGFRQAQARSAVDAAEQRLGVEGPHALEALLREALREATKAA
jgi:Holliday junction resolvasome RuvABC DNA-binding subunit